MDIYEGKLDQVIIEAWGRIYVDKVTDKNCYAIHTNVFKRICKEGGFNDKAFISWALKNGLIIGDSNNKPTKVIKFGLDCSRCYVLVRPEESPEE